MMSGVTDCYQPVERQLKITRRCLEVLAEFRNPAGIVTKSHLVTRDIDLLREMAAFNTAANNAKAGCPVSKLFKAEITMSATLEP